MNGTERIRTDDNKTDRNCLFIFMGRPDSDPITGRQQCGNFTAYYSSDPDGNLFYSKNPVSPDPAFPDMVRALVGTKAKKMRTVKVKKRKRKKRAACPHFRR